MMYLERFYNTDLAQASYMIGCQAMGIALVIDPNRSIEQYLDAAEQQGLTIVAVAETHIHADYVSGALELVRRTGATLYLSDEGPAEWKYGYCDQANVVRVHHGDSFMLGNIRIEVWHTPGHTPEHIVFLVTDTAATDLPIGVATGDFVFIGDVGRPDLLERAAGIAGTMEDGARQQFQSLKRFRQLPDYVQVWPGHGAGSACGKALGAIPQSTVGYERRVNWALQIEEEAPFVQEILSGQPEPPPYFAHMKRVNKIGPAPRPPLAPGLAAADVERVLNGELLLVDVRSADAFAAGHLAGSINLPFGPSFVSWAGWTLPYDRPLALLTEPGQAAMVNSALQLIGIDTIVGYWEAPVIEDWAACGRPVVHTNRMSAALAREHRSELVIDVRLPSEYAADHIPGSMNIPFQRLATGTATLPEPQPAQVVCQGGSRSPIAVSLLERHGWRDLTDISDGIDGWKRTDGPLIAERVAYIGE